jgi:hypothetical protein
LLNNSRNVPDVADESCLTKNQVDLGVAPPNPKSSKSLEKYKIWGVVPPKQASYLGVF